MGDDGIGIKVAEEISTQIMQEGIELIFGETDSDYALSKIDDGDLVFIIDSTYLDVNPGTVTFRPISDMMEHNSQLYSQHQPNLIQLLNTYGKKVEGFVIGIEVEKIDFNLEISDTLKNRLSQICKEVYDFVCKAKSKYCSH